MIRLYLNIFYCFYSMVCLLFWCSSSYICVLFLLFLFFPCCSSVLFLFIVFVAFECKQQQATSNNTQTLRITKTHLLNMLTFAEIQEPICCSYDVRGRACFQQSVKPKSGLIFRKSQTKFVHKPPRDTYWIPDALKRFVSTRMIPRTS